MVMKFNEAESTQPLFTEKKLFSINFIISIFLIIVLAIISLFVGVYDLSQDGGYEIFLITRIPRTLALMLSGAAMSMCGIVMQLMTQNKFVEPTTTGTIEWAGLGLLFMHFIIPNPSIFARMTGAILFSFLGTMIFFFFLRKVKLKSSLVVPLIGIMLGAIVSSISTFFSLLSDMSQTLEIWFAGSFAPVQRGRYEYLYLILIITVVVFIMADRLTVAGLGKDIATNLGLNYNKIIFIGTFLVSIAVGIVASVIGNLPFLGLIVPNLVSIFRGDDLRSNLPWVCVCGIGTITFCDILSRTIIKPFELPVSLILGTFGAIVFMILIIKQRRQK